MDEFIFEDFGYKSPEDFERIKKQPKVLETLRDREFCRLKMEFRILYKEMKDVQVGRDWIDYHQWAVNRRIHMIVYLNNLLKNYE